MADTDGDFRDFVGGFGGPLTRLAYLLTLTDDPESAERAQRLAITALTNTNRRWRDVQRTGAPEPIAVEALLARLAKRQRRRKVASVGLGEPFEPTETSGSDDEHEDDVALAVVREVLWRGWLTLGERQRVPLVFADLSVASRRLAGLDVPESFGSARRQEILAQQAYSVLQLALAQDVRLAKATAIAAPQLRDVLASVLTEHAQEALTPVDAYVVVRGQTARSRRRGAIAVIGVVAVLVAAAVTVVNVSTSRNRVSEQSAASAASSASAKARSNTVPAQVADLVVNWPIRGDLSGDTRLLANVRTAFVASHPDATGGVQILLATDTPWFRVVYATARSRTGIVQSWFYGPPGSEAVTEGSFSYGPAVAQRGVIANVLADTQGHGVLVVIAPPDAADVRLVDSQLQEVTPGDHVDEVSHPDGIAIRDETGVYVPSLLLQVLEGSALAWNGPVGTVELGGAASIQTAPANAPSSPPGSGGTGAANIAVNRGVVDPPLLAAAQFVEREWEQTGELGASGQPVILWGGNDAAGTKIVVMRVRTLHLADLIVVAWTDRPTADGEYLLAPDAPDYPLGFAYSSAVGPRIGVVVPNGVTTVDLVVDGVAQPKQPVSATGFASLQVNGQYGTLADQTFAVEMFDAAGHVVGTTPVPPTV